MTVAFTEVKDLEIIQANPGSPIIADFDTLKERIGSFLKDYEVGEISTDDEYQQLKRDRTALRKMIEGVDNTRKKVDNEYRWPLDSFDMQVKEALAPARDLESRMKGMVDEYDGKWEEQRKQDIKRHYEDYAPIIALPADGESAPLVPFDRIADQKWYKRSYSDVTAKLELEAIVNRIAEDEAQLDSLHLAHPLEAKAELFRTLDIGAAIARSNDIDEQEDRVRAMESLRDYQVSTDDEQVPGEPVTGAYTVRFETNPIHIKMTEEQADRMVALFLEVGIHGGISHD